MLDARSLGSSSRAEKHTSKQHPGGEGAEPGDQASQRGWSRRSWPVATGILTADSLGQCLYAGFSFLFVGVFAYEVF